MLLNCMHTHKLRTRVYRIFAYIYIHKYVHSVKHLLEHTTQKHIYKHLSLVFLSSAHIVSMCHTYITLSTPYKRINLIKKSLKKLCKLDMDVRYT